MPKSDTHASFLRRSLVYGLSVLMIWQPVLVAAAQPISPTHSTSGRPTLDAAPNGVPVVNIENPNSQGVSQNFYNELNVGSQGLILNNSKQVTQTQLGGYIEGNPNLSNGSASLILNEVIGSNPSSLNGYLEVGGRQADVVVANPNGITCNGCGFINTNHATLTTGKAIMDGGQLSGFDVQGGNIFIGENGLNGANTDRFDLIARSVQLAGELHANELNVVAGQQTVDHKTLETSNVTTDGDKPAFAIDSTALGGMYANRIRLIANEDGVGVKLDAPVAAQSGDLTLSANGQIEHSEMAASGDIDIASANHDVIGRGDVQSLANITVKADRYNNAGLVIADGDIKVTANELTNTGTLGGREKLEITADTLLNDQGGALLSNNTISLNADQVTNRLADIYTTGDLVIKGSDGGQANILENRSGRIEAQGDVTVDATDIRNVRDFLEWEDVLTGGNATYECIECAHRMYIMRYTFTEHFMRELDSATTGRSLLVSGGNMSLTGESLLNETSDILAFGNMALNVDQIDNLGLHSGEYTLLNHYKNYLYYGAHIDNVVYGIKPYNDRNYYGDAQYWSGGETEGLEYMRLRPNWGNGYYDPENFRDRENNFVHRNVPHIGEQLKILDSTTILGANIVAGGDMEMTGATLNNGDVGHREQENVSEADLIAVRDGAGDINSYDDYLTGVNGGLFSLADPDHPYLIETNAFFSSLDGLLGSQYMLSRLGWDPDGALRLLGDEFYEQQLIRQQILDLTGKVFLSDQYADANAQYRALLDNGIHAAEPLSLAVGVALTPEQINKLTDDIVWMVEKEVAGETVLVPQLFLSPNSEVIESSGALVASGGDMSISDGSVFNTGTIHFGGDANFQLDEGGLVNLGGEISGDGDLNVQSEGEIRNVSGTIQARNVALQSATAINNLRFVRQNELSDHEWREWHTDLGDAAVIVGLDSLALGSEGDITLSGSRLDGGNILLHSQGNIVIDTVVNAEGRAGNYYGGRLSESSVQHLGSEINASLGLFAAAANNISVIGSRLDSEGAVDMVAGNSIMVASAANSYSYDFQVEHDDEEKTIAQRNVRQQQSEIHAGEGMNLSAGADIIAIASKLESGGDMSLKAGGDIAFLAAQNSDYYLYESDKDGDFGAKSYKKDELQKVNHVRTSLKSGGDLTIDSGGNQHYQAARLEGGGDINIVSDGSITFESVKDLYRETHERNQGDLAWNKMSGEGTVDETLLQTEIVAAGNLAIDAAQGMTIDLKDMDQKSVSQLIDGMVANNPDLAWLKDAEANGQVEWNRVEEMHDSWDYESQNMGAATALVVAIVMAAVTAGAASAAIGSLAGASAGSGSFMAAAGTTAGATAGVGNVAATAMAVSASTTLATNTINNGGRVDVALKSMDNSETYQGLGVTALTAGLTIGLDSMFNEYVTFGREGVVASDPINNLTKGFNLNTASGAAGFTLHNVAQAGLNAGVSSSIYGTSFNDALTANLESQGNNVLSAMAFNQVGNAADFMTENAGLQKDTFTYNLFVEGGLGRTAMHSAVGGAVTEITSGDFATGAAAAGLNQIMSSPLSGATNALGGDNKWRTAGAQLAGLMGAVAVDGDVNEGAWVAKQADAYNRQLHREELKLIKDNLDEYYEERVAQDPSITREDALAELVMEALQEVDHEYDANIKNNPLAANFLYRISDQSDLRLISTDGQTTMAFEASAADYFNPSAYMDELYYSGMGLYDGGLDDHNLVRRVLTDPQNAWALEGSGEGAYYNYQDTWEKANHYFAGKLSEQNLEILKMTGLGMVGGSASLEAIKYGGRIFFIGGGASAGAGYHNDGVSGALTATSGYLQMFGAAGTCWATGAGCVGGAPVFIDGANSFYKGVQTNSKTEIDKTSLYSIGSEWVFDTPMPGVALDYSTSAFSLLKAPHSLLNPEKPNGILDVPFFINTGQGVWGQLNSGQLTLSGGETK